MVEDSIITSQWPTANVMGWEMNKNIQHYGLLGGDVQSLKSHTVKVS